MKEETQKRERKCFPITRREETINTRKIRRNSPLNSPWSHSYQLTRWRVNEESWSKWLKNCIGKIRNAVKSSVHRAPFPGRTGHKTDMWKASWMTITSWKFQSEALNTNCIHQLGRALPPWGWNQLPMYEKTSKEPTFVGTRSYASL